MFQTECIILKRKILNDSNVWYTLFSRDFGKINAFGKERKKAKPLDIGLVVTMRLKTKAKVSTLTDYDILKYIPYHNWKSSGYNNYLMLVHYLNLVLPFGEEFTNIFDGYKSLIELIKKDEDGKLSLFFLYKISFILGITGVAGIDLNLRENKNLIDKLNLIKKTSLSNLLELNLDNTELKILEKIIDNSYKDYIIR